MQPTLWVPDARRTSAGTTRPQAQAGLRCPQTGHAASRPHSAARRVQCPLSRGWNLSPRAAPAPTLGIRPAPAQPWTHRAADAAVGGVAHRKLLRGLGLDSTGGRGPTFATQNSSSFSSCKSFSGAPRVLGAWVPGCRGPLGAHAAVPASPRVLSSLPPVTVARVTFSPLQ